MQTKSLLIMNEKIIITGANGFLGDALCSSLYRQNNAFLAVVRKNTGKVNWPLRAIGDINKSTDWSPVLSEASCVIHTAARVHVMNGDVTNPFDKFREVNTCGTLNLAQQAADAGVKRFIFISSIKVNGEFTDLDLPFRPDTHYIPTDPYGLSKYEAEVGLREIAEKTGMEVVIIRPPLVYGPGVKANFASMMKWMNKGLPLPLGGINKNKRSLVSVDNLVDLILTCIEHPKAANQTFFISDDDDVSTSQLLTNMATALDAPNRLLPIPSSWFILAAKLIGKPAISQRLCASLQVDISKTKDLLDWTPPYSSAECMKKTADAFREKLNVEKNTK